MKLSRKFVNEYTNLYKIDFNEYAKEMLKLGNEYESMGKLVNVEGLIIGEVESCEMHPESDHLHICKVNIGKEVLDIVDRADLELMKNIQQQDYMSLQRWMAQLS